MKKLCIVLLLAATGKTLSAQPIYYFNPPPASESIFNSPVTGSTNNRFDFLLPQNNRMVIEVYRIHHLEKLPNLDSLFKKIWTDLEPIYDSLSNPLMVRRVDYAEYGTDTRIRVRTQQPAATYFSYKDEELVQMKVDQDTLRFKGYVTTPVTPLDKIRLAANYYTVTLYLNNISDVAKIPDGTLSSGLRLLLPELSRSLKKSPKKISGSHFYAMYDLKQGKRISPRTLERMGFGNKHGLTPYAQAGIQYARGAWIPSAGIGVEYYYNQLRYSKFAMRLLWEPHFYFQRDDKDKVDVQRNDFVTIRFFSGFRSTNPGRTFEFNQNFSVGAMIYKKGDLFEKGTYKFGLPGLHSKNILIEPEFFFNEFFRNFSPSLKLIVSLD